MSTRAQRSRRGSSSAASSAPVAAVKAAPTKPSSGQKSKASRGDKPAQQKQSSRSKAAAPATNEDPTDDDEDDEQPQAELDHDFEGQESDETDETDSDSDAEMPPPTKARSSAARSRAKAPKRSMKAPSRKRGVASLASSIMGSASSAIAPLAEAWSDRLQDDGTRPAAAYEFMELLYDAAGLLGDVVLPQPAVFAAALDNAAEDADAEEEEDVSESAREIAEVAEQARDSFATGLSLDSCLSKTSQAARRQSARFVALMEALPAALGESQALGTAANALLQWTVEASSADVPLLRLAATSASMAFGLGLCRLHAAAAARAEEAKVNATGSAKSAERARSKASSPQQRDEARRLAAFASKEERKAETLRETAVALEGAVESLREAVAANRFRDTDARVRAVAIGRLAEWVAADPDCLLQPRKIRSIGWALYDRDEHVREAAASGLAALLLSEHTARALEPLWAKFSARVAEMLRDVHPGAAHAAVKCFTAALPWELVEVEHVVQVEQTLVRRSEPEVRRACGEFLLSQMPEMTPVEEIIAEEKQRVRHAAAEKALEVIATETPAAAASSSSSSSSSSSKKTKKQPSRSRRGSKAAAKADDNDNDEEENEDAVSSGESAEARAKRVEAQVTAAADEAEAALDVGKLRMIHSQRQLLALLGVVRRCRNNLAAEGADLMRLVTGYAQSSTAVETAAKSQADAVGREWAAVAEVLVSAMWGAEDAGVLRDWDIHRSVILSEGTLVPSLTASAASGDEEEGDEAAAGAAAASAGAGAGVEEEEDEALAMLKAPLGVDGQLRVTAVRLLASCVRWAQGRALQTEMQGEAMAMAAGGADEAVEEACDMLAPVLEATRGEMGGLLAVLDLASAVPVATIAAPGNETAAAAAVSAASDALLRGSGGSRPGAGARFLASLAVAGSAKGKKNRGRKQSKKQAQPTSSSSSAGAATALREAVQLLLARAASAGHVLVRVATGDVDALREATAGVMEEESKADEDADEDADAGDDQADASADAGVGHALRRRCRNLLSGLADSLSRLAEAVLAADMTMLGGAVFDAPCAEDCATMEELEARALAASGGAGAGLAMAESLLERSIATRTASGTRGSAAETAVSSLWCCRLVLGCVARGGAELGAPLVVCAADARMEAARAAHAALQLLGAVFVRSMTEAAATTLSQGVVEPEAAWDGLAPVRGLRDMVLRVSAGALADATAAADAIDDATAPGGQGFHVPGVTLDHSTPARAARAAAPDADNSDAENMDEFAFEMPDGKPESALAALASATRAAAWRAAVEVLRLCPPSLADTALWPLALPDGEAARWTSGLVAEDEAEARVIVEEAAAAGHSTARAVLQSGEASEIQSVARTIGEADRAVLREQSRSWVSDEASLVGAAVSALAQEPSAARTAAAAFASEEVPEVEAAAALATISVSGFSRQPADRAAAAAAAAAIAAMAREGSQAAAAEEPTVAALDGELSTLAARLGLRLEQARASAAADGHNDDDDDATGDDVAELEALVECVQARRAAIADAAALGAAAQAESAGPLTAALIAGGIGASTAAGAASFAFAQGSADDPVALLARASLKELRARSEAAWVSAAWAAIRAAVREAEAAESESQDLETLETERRAAGDDDEADALARQRREATERHLAAMSDAIETSRAVVNKLGPSVTAAKAPGPRTRAGRTLLAVVQQLQRDVSRMLLRSVDVPKARKLAERRRAARAQGADIYTEDASADAVEAAEEVELSAEDPEWGSPPRGLSCRAACTHVVMQRIADSRTRAAVLATFKAAALGLPRPARLAVLAATDAGAAGEWVAAVQLRLLLEGDVLRSQELSAQAAMGTPRSTSTPGRSTGRSRGGRRADSASRRSSGGRHRGGAASTPSTTASGRGSRAPGGRSAARQPSEPRSVSESSRGGSVRRSLVEDDEAEDADMGAASEEEEEEEAAAGGGGGAREDAQMRSKRGRRASGHHR